ncbi:unnamed protein product, partial [Rotaria sp. Silwood2]
MYVIGVGTIKFGKFPYWAEFDSEIVETSLEYAVLCENLVEVMEKRKHFAVIEDDFGPTLEQMVQAGGTSPSYDTLMEACRAHCYGPEEVNMHCNKSRTTFRYFTDKGVAEDDAKAYALAIAFYTGMGSAKLSMEANIVARGLVDSEERYPDGNKADIHAAVIMYYLIKGLAHINFYWGTV